MLNFKRVVQLCELLLRNSEFVLGLATASCRMLLGLVEMIGNSMN